MSININSPDIQCAIRSVEPVMVGHVPVNHVPLSRIAKRDLGFLEYNRILSLLCITKDQCEQLLPGKDVPSVLAVICATALSNQDYADTFSRACHIFFGLPPKIDTEEIKIVFQSPSLFECLNCGNVFDTPKTTGRGAKEKQACPKCGGSFDRKVEYEISEDNFDDVIAVLKLRNGIKPPEEEEWGNPADEKARQIIARRNEIRKKKSKQSGDGNGITLWELVDIFASLSSMTYEEVMGFDLFQFNTQFSRLKAYDEYKTNIDAIIHGAKSSEIDYKHWLRHLDDKQDDD